MLIFILLGLTFGSDICDVSVDGGVCLYEGESVIKPPAKLSSLAGYWTFDDTKGLDYSGYNNHGKSSVPAGHSSGGRGSSAKFSGSEYFEVPSDDSISAKIFSITFWVYLEKDDTSKSKETWCPILQKGDDDLENLIYERTPAIFWNRETRALKVYVTTTESSDFPEGEYVDSYARLLHHRWNHIAVVRTQSKIKLYVNGILDNSNSTSGWTNPNESPLYIGGTPTTIEKCLLHLLVDETRYYEKELSDLEIEAESAGALGQVEPRFVRLGCIDCTVSTAESSCTSDYHLCTSIELHSGAYSVARINGWTEWNKNVWSYSALESDSESNDQGLGLCCLNLG